MKILERPRNNLIAIGVAVGFATLSILLSPHLKSAGMAMLILPWIPLVLGVFLVGAYFLLNYLLKGWGWIVSLLGIGFLLFLGVRTYFVG